MIIQLANGITHNINDFKLKRLKHYIPSISMNHNFLEVDGRSSIYTGSSFKARTITVDFIFESYDIYDYYAIRDMVNALFTRREEFYITFVNEPHKRYKVIVASSFLLPPNERMDSFSIEFICTELYGESVTSTLNLPKEWDANIWSWNNAITWDDDINYTFNTNTFSVINRGNVVIDPREVPLKITLNGVFENYVSIKNKTTNETFVLNRGINLGNNLILDGINPIIDVTNIFALTNKRLISLNEGVNEFEITGGTVRSMTFDFKFRYL